MYERECDLFEIKSKEGNKEVPLGRCHLKVLYDEDVFGARIIAVKDAMPNGGDVNAEDDYLCNHLIAMQTTLDVDEDDKRCSWSALDFSADPPTYRSFVAAFTDLDGGEDEAQSEFVSAFTEGKELAEQSEILEQPNSGGDLNPDEMYYGQGAEYDDT
jgi:hypothetical protein